MARRWMGAALLAGWLGVSAATYAQAPPAAPGASGAAHAGDLPPGYGPPADPGGGLPPGGPPPGYPGADCGLPPLAPPPGGEPSAESLPPNAWSTVHPEQISRSPRFYLGADYLHWWVRKSVAPPLVTAGNITDAVPGALNQPGTQEVLGPGGVGRSEESGLRVTALFWFNQDHNLGVEASAFVMEGRTGTLVFGGQGTDPNLLVARPFINPNVPAQDADPVVVPGVQGGTLVVSASRWFMGGDANVRYEQDVGFGPFDRMGILGGARVLSLDERLLFAEQVNEFPSPTGTGGNVTYMNDSFFTFNRFYGGQIGLEGETHVGQLTFTLTGKLAVGQTWQKLMTNGVTEIIVPGGGIAYDPTRGFLVQPTNNIPRFTRREVSFVPSAQAELTWEFNPHLRVGLGYDFLFWSRVLRPGEQIDSVVNVGAVGAAQQFGLSPHPQILMHTTGFWAQGFNVGVQVSY